MIDSITDTDIEGPQSKRPRSESNAACIGKSIAASAIHEIKYEARS